MLPMTWKLMKNSMPRIARITPVIDQKFCQIDFMVIQAPLSRRGDHTSYH
jgi:hypothetical protein